MPIGTSKIGVLGGKVPGGTVTFNTSGTFSVPSGVKKVNITGKGGAGNPGNAGSSGNAGNFGTGGAGGGGGGAPKPGNWATCVGRGGDAWQGAPIVGCGPNGPYPGKGCVNGGNQGSYNGNYCCANSVGTPGGTGTSGNAGSAGSAGSAGNAGNTGGSSTGLCKTFTGGAGGNAGTAGNSGNGGAGGSGGVGGSGGPTSSGGSGGAGGSAAGNGGTGGNAYIQILNYNGRWGGNGGGGAGVSNGGASGTSPANSCCYKYNMPLPYCAANDYLKVKSGLGLNGGGGQGGTNNSVCLPYYSPNDANTSPPSCANAGSGGFPLSTPLAPTNMTGGRGGTDAGFAACWTGASTACLRAGRPAKYRCNTLTYTNSNPLVNALTPTNPFFRSGGGGGAGGMTLRVVGGTGGGGGGGGRGAAGNAGGSGGSGGAGSAATPATYNCVTVTPGGSYPISVASGGQVNILWNPQ